MCDAGPMAQTVCVILSVADRERLQGIADDRNQLRKHVERARIVLASAERKPAQRVAAHAVSTDRRYGAGSSATPRPGSKACCATRPASPAKPRSQRRSRREWWR